MSQNDEILEKLQQLLSHKKSTSYYASKLGISEEEVEELKKELKTKPANYYYQVGPLDLNPNTTFSSTTVDVEKGTMTSALEVDFEPKTVEDLAKLHKIDLTRYKISNYWSKLKSNGKFTSSVFCTSKKKADYTPEDFSKFLENWTPKTISLEGIVYSSSTEKEVVDVELNIADFHLAKKTFGGDNLDSKAFDYYLTVAKLVEKIKQNYNIRKLVFPISNDFFHTDTYQNTTTNGTPQDVVAWYDEEYEKGFDILANSINFLVTQADQVEVILVQGNHDRTKGFFVAHALEKFFSYTVPEEKLKFQRHHSVTKFTVLGDTFIGYHHGNSTKLEGLPLIFASSPDSAPYFGLAKYREVHTGDKHHYMAKEINGSGVRVQQMPSLSGTDRWHADNGFINQVRAALALVYHPKKGKIAEFEERI